MRLLDCVLLLLIFLTTKATQITLEMADSNPEPEPAPVGNTHDEIAAALTRVYTFFVKIGYVTEAEMKWPPHSPDDLDVEHCKGQGLTEDVIALLQKIPWTTATVPGSEFTVHLLVESFLINFSNRAGIETGRLTFGHGDDPVMEPHLVALATRDCGLGHIIAIDAQSGEYRSPSTGTILTRSRSPGPGSQRHRLF